MRFALNRGGTHLRISMLMLLVLGLFLRPVLNHVGDLHEVAHAAAAAHHDHHHDHGHEHDHDAGHDEDHVAGSHALLHQADAGASAGILMSFTRLLPIRHIASQPIASTTLLRTPYRLATPFRPPIA